MDFPKFWNKYKDRYFDNQVSILFERKIYDFKDDKVIDPVLDNHILEWFGSLQSQIQKKQNLHESCFEILGVEFCNECEMKVYAASKEILGDFLFHLHELKQLREIEFWDFPLFSYQTFIEMLEDPVSFIGELIIIEFNRGIVEENMLRLRDFIREYDYNLLYHDSKHVEIEPTYGNVEKYFDKYKIHEFILKLVELNNSKPEDIKIGLNIGVRFI
ncbi:MAG: hypothetical protein ACTSRW_03135 [Candidatus Helarchaeota archaeon]